MKTPFLSVLPLLAYFTTASPLFHSERAVVTAQTIFADIDAIDVGVNKLRSEIAAYNGGLLSETPLLDGFTVIEVANRKGYADANLATPFSASDSTAIVQEVIDTVGNDIPASVNELKAKKALFEASGQDGVVVGTLKVLLYDHDTFSAAVSAKLTADKTRGAAVVKKIHDAIQGGIDYFST